MLSVTENGIEQNTFTGLKPDKEISFGVYAKYIKRPMDFILALIALIVFSPILLIIALLIRISIGSPVLFKQKRPGKNEKIFTLYKFRTMTDERGENGELLPDDERLTKLGSFLRSLSLDELPELINIIKGDLSIVGPRPLLIEYLPLYNDRQRQRHTVRPGLTGLAQANGRNAINWEEKFELDIKYIGNITFFGDVKIILTTVYTVLTRKGISSTNCETMEQFKGNSNNDMDSVQSNHSV
jgi:undecaprenyl phosphate N,N'-diacetylbacillosamine 1-phosphate transferase